MVFQANSRTEYLAEDLALDVLGPHLRTLRACVRDAWGAWVAVRGTFQSPSNRTRAAVISNAFIDRAKAAFDSTSGVSCIENHDRVLIVIDNRLIVRFKMLDSEFRTRNYPTAASLAMDAQEQVCIPECGDLPRVILGYKLGGMPLDLESIWIAYLIGQHVQWKHQIEGDSYPMPQPLPMAPPPQAGPATIPARFKWKEDDADTKKNTG